MRKLLKVGRSRLELKNFRLESRGENHVHYKFCEAGNLNLDQMQGSMFKFPLGGWGWG